MATPDVSVLLMETIRINVRKRLEAKFLNENAFIHNLIPDIQDYILDEIMASIIEYVGTICEGSIHQSGNTIKTRNGNLFRLSLAPNIRCPEELHVTFYPAYTPRPKLSDSRYKLGTNYGGYSYIVITNCLEASLDNKFIQMIVECVISTTYKWTYNRVYANIYGTYEKITNRLYSRLREIYPELSALDNLWLGFVHKGKCQYLIESNRRDSIFLAMSKIGRKMDVEPLNLASQIIGMDLPFEKSATHDAFVSNKPLHVNIGKLSYSKSSPSLVAAEQIVFGSDEIVVIPICHIERADTFLVAFSSVNNSEFWIGALERNKDDLWNILREEISSFSKISKILKPYFTPPETSRLIGDTAGHFLATLYERIGGH